MRSNVAKYRSDCVAHQRISHRKAAAATSSNVGVNVAVVRSEGSNTRLMKQDVAREREAGFSSAKSAAAAILIIGETCAGV